MTGPKFDATISVRDIISLLAIIVTGIIAFQIIASRVEALEKSDDGQNIEIGELSKSNIEIGKALAEIGVDIRYLRRAAEKENRTSSAE